MKRSVIFLKTRISFGGASFSGLELLSLFKSENTDIKIITGYIHPRVKQEIAKTQHFSIRILRTLDRYLVTQKSSTLRAKEIVDFILKATRPQDILIISQPFLSDGTHYSKAVIELSNKRQVLLRLHDPIEDRVGFKKINKSAIALPTTHIMARWMRSINKNVQISVIPSLVNTKNFELTGVDKQQILRKHKIKNNDFIIFQPTRISKRKNIKMVLRLASRLNSILEPKRKVSLIVAGGNEFGSKKKLEKEEIIRLAKRLKFNKLILLNNITPTTTTSYMKVASLVSFMSKTESWGRIPAESAVASVPCLTTNYCDENGENVFKEVYSGFKFIVEPKLNKTKISDQTFKKILRLANNPSSWDKKLAHNRHLVKKYDKNRWENTVKKIMARIKQ